ncbi:AraC family transcriptional regulator [Bacillus sp. JJ722]|uniref:AraC family transcriptional regulator n=1 Tax=Bacillus sp. JJ722 TaxID=3122973 RepID=UPI002FFEB4E0
MRIKLLMADENERNKIINWLHDGLPSRFYISEIVDNQQADIYFVEVVKIFDWVKIRRLQKKFSTSIICPILSSSLSYSSALAIDLQLQSILVKPLQKRIFLRTAKKMRTRFIQKQNMTFTYSDLFAQISDRENAPFQEAFLRRILRGEVVSEKEVIEARTYLPSRVIPNVVLLLQGFSIERLPDGKGASSLVKECIREHFITLVPYVSFLPYQKHLLILMRIPEEYSSFKQWSQGEDLMLQVIHLLKEKYGIHVYIGIGDTYQEPLLLHHSYGQARKARRMPAPNHIQLRYFDDITKNPLLLKTIEFIVQNCSNNITISDAASFMNFSVTHFSRLFKKETGKSYVDYVAFIKIYKSLPLLRRTNHTMEQIAAETGFNTPNYYSSTFKKLVGLSPSEYRATYEIIFK